MRAPRSPPGKSTLAGAAGRWIVLGRLALLLAAVGAVAGGLLVGRRPEPAPAAQDARYLCPMHRSVRSPTPGTCPICGMDLEQPDVAGPPPEAPAYNVQMARAHAGTLSMRAPARVDPGGVVTALLHRDEIAALAADERASFQPALFGAAPLAVRRRAEPPRPWDQDTFEVSFDADDADERPAPDAAGSVVFAARRRQIVVIPEIALLQSPDGDYVLVASRDDRTFTRRKVSIGRVTFGNVPIVDGLAAGERIATRRVALLDAARRMRDPAAPQIEVGSREAER